MTAIPYYSFKDHLTKRFGFAPRKVSVDAGFSCPNRDGTVGLNGCSFCRPDSFTPGSARTSLTVTQQIQSGITRIQSRYPNAKFLAYFQPFTNTHAPLEKLQILYEAALSDAEVIGLCIGTRPDCVNKKLADYLDELAQSTFIQLELGLQSASNKTLERISRGHTVTSFTKTMKFCAGRKFEICGHMIAGLPGETPDDALKTSRLMVNAGISGIKIHNLHIVKGTKLAEEYMESPFPLWSRNEYISTVADIIEQLPKSINIQRLCGTCSPEILVAPDWTANPNIIIELIRKELIGRNTKQGIFAKDRYR